nr:hypothetical protein [Micromonospora sp. DSM 115978]
MAALPVGVRAAQPARPCRPRHPERTEDPKRAIAHLLWFPPRGDGKTEAYLGLTVFAIAVRRLQPAYDVLTAGAGLTVLMRYTLRLLTIQQFERAATLICAAETLRRADEATWGATPLRSSGSTAGAAPCSSPTSIRWRTPATSRPPHRSCPAHTDGCCDVEPVFRLHDDTASVRRRAHLRRFSVPVQKIS